MARKKIGAIIALDGEREYKQAVTNCNRALNQFKAEMELVKAESEGQEDSLDSLGRKHEVLSKVLDAQKQKQEEVEKGLNHARESYDKMGGKINTLKETLEKATKELKDMEDAGESSEDQLKQQREQVEQLTSSLKKSEENYQKASDRIQKWETDLTKAKTETAKASNALNDNAKAMKEVAEESVGAATSLEAVKEAAANGGGGVDLFGLAMEKIKSPTAIATAGVAALGAAFTKAAKESVQFAMNMQTVSAKLQGATGATAAEMKKYEAAMQNIYNNNFGENLEDIASAMAKVKQYTGELDASELENMTENAMALEDVFDMDLSETIRGVNSLTKNMGITSKQAFDLMAKGAQNGLDKSGELGDNIAEYGQLWAQAGFSAEEMFAILQNGLDAGAYNLDKVNDFVKEFAISLSDGRIEENLDSFSQETQNLFWAMKDGKATSKDVFYSVVQDLKACTNQQEALTLASTVWSALGEDNAMSVITALGDVNDAYADVGGTMESIKDISYDSVESKLESLGRKTKTEILEPVADNALPAINKALDGVGKILDAIAEKINPPKTALEEFTEEVTENNQQVRTVLDNVEESMGNAHAQAEKLDEYKKTLLELNGVTEKTEYQKFQVKKIVEELSDTIPELSEAWDEEAGSINLSNEELTALMENQEAYIIQAAAIEAKNQLINEGFEKMLSAEKAKSAVDELKKSLEEMEETENFEALIGINDELLGQYTDLKSQLSDAEEEYQMAKTAVDDYNVSLEQAKEDIDTTSEKLGGMVAAQGEAKESTEALTEAQGANGEAVSGLADGIEQDTGRIIESYVSYKDTVLESIQSQMNLFEDFGEVHALETSKLLENMESQVNGVKEWSNNLEELARKGVDEGLLQYLAELGPDGAEYVATFNTMTTDELDRANKAWRDSMDLKSGVDEEVDSAIQTFVEGISGGKEKMQKAMEDLGVNTWDGFKNAIEDKQKEAEESGQELLEAFMKSAEQTAETHSPSKRTERLGKYTVEGLKNGIARNTKLATEAAKSLATKTITSVNNTLKQDKFYQYGQRVPQGLARGISAGKMAPINQAKSMIESVRIVASRTPSLYNHGLNLAYGLANGIYAGSSSVVNAVSSMCAAAVNQATADLGIHSPSKVFEELGGYTAEGFGIGYEKEISKVNDMIRDSIYSPETERSGIVEAGANGEMADMFRSYLPYLRIIAEKELSMYPSRRAFEKDVTQIVDSGSTKMKRIKEAARGY
nr:phage tail tape measure protein [uncultured Blautia sp.]